MENKYKKKNKSAKVHSKFIYNTMKKIIYNPSKRISALNLNIDYILLSIKTNQTVYIEILFL